MRERYLHRCREQSFAIRASMSAVGIDVVSVHKVFAYGVVRTVRINVVSSHLPQNRIWYHKIAENIARYKRMNDL